MSDISVCCRLCLVKNDMLVHLKCCDIDNVSYFEKIQLVSPIIINNPLNHILIWICQPCVQQLNTAHKFIQNCLASDKFFYEHSLQLTNANTSNNEECNLDIVNSTENLNSDMNMEPIKEECDINEYDNFANIENCLEPLIDIKDEPAALYIKPEPNINDPLVTCDEKKLEPLFCPQFPAPNVTIKEEEPEEVHFEHVSEKNDISSAENPYSSEIVAHNPSVSAVAIKQEDDSSWRNMNEPDPEYIVPNIMEQAPSEPKISYNFKYFLINPTNITSNADASVRWTHNSTKLLLDYYKKHHKEVGSLKIRNFKKLWEIISTELKSKHKINVNSANCENKWRVLERNYKKYVDDNKKAGRGRKDFDFADEMFEILEKKKNICPEILLPSNTIAHLPEVEQTEKKAVRNATENAKLPVTGPSKESEKKSNMRRKPKRKLICDTLQEIRNDRKEYYEKMLKIQAEKLEIYKQTLQERKTRNMLIKERNEILKMEIN